MVHKGHKGTHSSTARINTLDGFDSTYYTVTLTQEDGSSFTRTARTAEEALQIKENWESGKHRFLKG